MTEMDDATNILFSIDKEDVKSCLKSLEQESDRGAVLVSIAMFDEMLYSRLNKLFHQGNQDARDRLLKPPLGAISGFSSKADLAFCLGLIPKHIYSDVRLLNKLRNKCAHDWDKFHLTKEIIDEYIEPMFIARALRSQEGDEKGWHPLKDKSPREIFSWVMALFFTGFNMYKPILGLEKN
jgi:DNA-binding MltR family transcriptional regulator